MITIGPDITVSSKIKSLDLLLHSDQEDTVNLSVDKAGLTPESLSYELLEGEKQAIQCELSNTDQTYTVTATSTDTTLRDNVSAYWALDDNDETATIQDSSDNGNDIELTGDVSSAFATDEGINGYGMRFPSTNHARPKLNAIDEPAGAFFQVGKPFTVAMWVNLDTVPSFSAFLGSSMSTLLGGLCLGQRFGRINPNYRDSNDPTAFMSLYGTYMHQLHEGVDHFLYYSYNGGDISDPANHLCFVDGEDRVLYLTSSSGTVSDITRQNDVVLFGNGNTTTYNSDGVLSDVYLTNQPGSEEEALKLWNMGRGRTFSTLQDSDSCTVTVSAQSGGTLTLSEAVETVKTAIEAIEPTEQARTRFSYQEGLMEQIEQSRGTQRGFNFVARQWEAGEIIGSTQALFDLNIAYPQNLPMTDFDDLEEMFRDEIWPQGILSVQNGGGGVTYYEDIGVSVLTLSVLIVFE